MEKVTITASELLAWQQCREEHVKNACKYCTEPGAEVKSVKLKPGHTAPYHGDGEAETDLGEYRKVLFTSPRSQLVAMTLLPGEEIGAEVHDGDQHFVVLSGSGHAEYNGSNCELKEHQLLSIPAGTEHNVVNSGSEPLKLITIYSPPQHKAGEETQHKSAETPTLEATPDLLGTHGLWHTPSKKVPEKQKLPNYIEHIAHALMRSGHDESQAIAMAVAAVKRWSQGYGAWGRKQKVTPVVQAAAQRALAEWEKLKASHH